MATIQEFNYSADIMRALLWQYNKAQALQSLIEQKQAWYDENQKEFWESWQYNVFDLNTADAFGLTVWSIILDIPIIVVTEPPAGTVGFGWGPYHRNFTHGNFRAVAGTQELTVEQSRTVLKMRYYQITSRGTIPEINQFMARLFANYGPCYVLDNLDMTMTYVFEFSLPTNMGFIFKNFDLLPRPAGVAVDYEVISS